MPKRKKCLFLLFLVALFILGETIYLPKKNEEFQLIYDSISDTRKQNVEKKEEMLKNAYGFDDYRDYSIEYSKILFRDVYHFNKEATIYKGSRNNIQKNNLVINKDGLIGIVSEVNKNTSKVQLLCNENTSLSVKVNDSYGILKYRENQLRIEGIDNKAEIQIGDVVITSDISIYPEDILIGKVEDIIYDKYEIEQIVFVTPAVQFDSVSYIGVITDLRGVE